MGEIHARLETRVLRLDPNERQSHHRLCNRLLERSVVSCASPQRCALIRFCSSASAGGSAMLLILTRLVLRALSSEHRHAARITVSRKEEKRLSRRERSM